MIMIYYATWLCQLTQLFVSSFTDKFVFNSIFSMSRHRCRHRCDYNIRMQWVQICHYNGIFESQINVMCADGICTSSSGTLHGQEWAIVAVSQRNSDETDLKS